ncbi:MAG: S8 family serine peptidase [Candidatus Omnitrophica bacterium]|nr:S8 family serine peptidase [Candidatus Omnitrophota bacterium]
MKRQAHRVAVCVFAGVGLSFLLAYAEDPNWSGMDLTHKNPKDSVNWDDIDPVAKPPKPAPTDREHPGEKIGLCGPVIAYGGRGSSEALVVYDQCGTVTGVVTKKDAKTDPDSAQQTLGTACRDSLNTELPRFFKGQLLTEDDLTMLVGYVVDKNRLRRFQPQGSGIICGLDLKETPGTPGGVTVNSGYALDSSGSDIVVPTDRPVDLIKVEQDAVETPQTAAAQDTEDASLPDTSKETPPQTSQPDQFQRFAEQASGAEHTAGVHSGGTFINVAPQDAAYGSEEASATVPSAGNFSEIAPRVSFSYDIAGDGRTRERAQIPAGWRPQTVIMLRLGLTQKEFDEVTRQLASDLASGKIDKNWFKIGLALGGVYFLEEVYCREYQDPSVDPDDPLYLRGGNRSSGGKGLAIGFGGFSIGKSSGGPAEVHDQWALRRIGFTPRINADSAWNIEDGSEKNVVVALIDSGLDMTHPDGPAHVWTNPGEIPDNGIDDDGNGYIDDIHGWNFLDENNDLTDTKGHGTFVAGIVAAKTNNGIGMAGINPGAVIMPLKAGDAKNLPDSLAVFRALRYAANNGARIITISLGGEGVSQLEQLGVNYAYAKGALVIVAGGNQSGNIADYGPPALRRVLPIGGLDFEGTRSIVSNTGANLALAAPDEEIYSLRSKDAEWEGPSADRERLYFKQSGTSFSAPLVAGTASLLLAKNPHLTHAQLEDILLDTAGDLEEPGWDADTGAGLLNASRALAAAPENILTVRPTEIIVSRDGRKISAVDIFGIIRGNLDSYTVELGKGEKPDKWKVVAEGKTESVEYGFITRIGEDMISRGRKYVVRITACDTKGAVKVASFPIDLKGGE